MRKVQLNLIHYVRNYIRNTAAHNDIKLLLKINYRLFTSVIIEFLFAAQFFTYTETADDEAKDMEINDARDRTLRPSEEIIATCAKTYKKREKNVSSSLAEKCFIIKSERV